MISWSRVLHNYLHASPTQPNPLSYFNLIFFPCCNLLFIKHDNESLSTGKKPAPPSSCLPSLDFRQKGSSISLANSYFLCVCGGSLENFNCQKTRFELSWVILLEKVDTFHIYNNYTFVLLWNYLTILCPFCLWNNHHKPQCKFRLVCPFCQEQNFWHLTTCTNI